MTKLFGLMSLLVLALSCVFHVASFFPATGVSLDLAWPLHLGAMASFAAMGFNFVSYDRRRPKPSVQGLFANWRAQSQQGEEFWSMAIGFVPRSIRGLCAAMGIYAFLNFGFSMILLDGSPKMEAGKYYLHDHGQNLREVTKEKYDRMRAYELRGASGHWMLFAIFPAAYFWFVQPGLQKSTETTTDETN